ncbi:MAG: vitamin K epoxide reductase family protein [Terracidiphilus sp.]
MHYVILALAIAGVVVSSLALQLHYSTGAAPCDINSHWDCGIVNHSSFSSIAGVPVAILGIVGYLVLGGLAFARQRFLTFFIAFVGFLFAFRLSMIEEYGLGVWCIYCAISQGIIALILLLSLGWFAAEYIALKRAAPKASS